MAYSCGTCGDERLRITVETDAFKISCGQGHELVPVPGTVIEFLQVVPTEASEDWQLKEVLADLVAAWHDFSDRVEYDRVAYAVGRASEVLDHHALSNPTATTESGHD